PGMYATLPGAYRVVQVASNVSPAAVRSYFNGDGSLYITGQLGNKLTGATAALTSVFQVQPGAVWQRYAKINTNFGTAFFRDLAATQGVAPPPLPLDGGVLTVGATSTLALNGTNDFSPGAGGRGGEVDISAGNILIIADDLKDNLPTAAQNYLV